MSTSSIIKGKLPIFIITDDILPGFVDVIGIDFCSSLQIQDDIERSMNGPPTDQRLVRNLVSEVIHPQTKRNTAQWKKEQKMRRRK